MTDRPPGAMPAREPVVTIVASRDQVSRASLTAAGQLLPRFALAVGVLYLGFALLYATRLAGPGGVLLVALTTTSACGFLTFSRVTWLRGLSVRMTHVAIGVLGAVIIANVTIEYAVSRQFLHGFGFVMILIACGVLLPTVHWLIAFMTASLLSWLATTLAFDIDVLAYEATLGLGGASMVGAALFYMRERMTKLAESLRLSVDATRDHEILEILDNIADAVLLHRRGRVAYANPAVAQLLGLSAAALVGKPLPSLVSPRSAQRLAALLESHPTGNHTIELVAADETLVVLEMAEPRTIWFERDRAVMWVGRDITASQAALQAKLLMADRMAVAGALAEGLAHELNNPLAYVQLNLSVLERALEPAGPIVSSAIRDIGDGVSRIVSIVGELATVSPLQDDAAEVHVDSTIRHALELAHNELRHRAEVVVDSSPVPDVLINKSKLTQALRNLLIHAARGVDGAPGERIVVRSYTDGAGRVVIEIASTGPAVSAEVAKRAFEPFFTTRSDGFGGGLGLYYCHSVVTAAGGTLELRTDPGEPVTFRVVLPARPSTVERPSAPFAGGAVALRVLVIDDEAAVGRAIQKLLTDCEVTVSTSGADGIARYEALKPDLVLCDIMMPEVSGPVVYETLRERHPEIADRVVFMTGGAFTKKAREFVASTALQVLKKPVEVSVLYNLVARYDRERRAQGGAAATGPEVRRT